MNWITRCPECATVYQLAPEQIDAARGWVRCGHCQHAFDSTGLILAWAGRAHAEPAASKAGIMFDDVDAAQRLDVDALLNRKELANHPDHDKASDDLNAFEKALSSFQPEIEKAIDQLALSPASASPSDDSEDLVGDVESAKSQRRWPAVLLLWVLILSLLAQWAWIERFALVARFPVAQTHLQKICQVFSCEPLHVRDLHGLVIDTSSFLQRDNGFELQWVVRNTTEQSVLMTALEVTLQDAQGNPVLRRVFMPDQVNAPTVMAPSQVWQGTMHMLLTNDTVVTGYRVLNFYP
jgi:predicted Zn finger-like uncharacterized protein